MGNLLTTDAELTTVANAIRSKGGTSAQLGFPTGMKNAIDALNVGAGLNPAAAAGDIRYGKKAVVNRTTITGTATERTSSDLTVNVNTVTAPAGYYGASASKTVGTAKAATTYNTSSSDQSISSGLYLVGNQTIKAVTTSGIDPAVIREGYVIKVGDANNPGRIKNVTGTYTPTLQKHSYAYTMTGWTTLSAFDTLWVNYNTIIIPADLTSDRYDGYIESVVLKQDSGYDSHNWTDGVQLLVQCTKSGPELTSKFGVSNRRNGDIVIGNFIVEYVVVIAI